MRQLSKQGAAFTASKEAIILEAYPDPGTGAEPWTIGGGHTDAAGAPRVRPGDIWPLNKAFAVLRADLEACAKEVDDAVDAGLTQAGFDALVSFHFNTGAIRSGSVDDKLNAGREEAALATWSAYVNAGGKRMQGLARRRAEEIGIYRSGVYPQSRILVKDRARSQGRYITLADMPWGEEPAPAELALDIRTAPIVTSPVKRTKSGWRTCIERILQ